jgi:DNA-binding response OmpR family regulator
MRILLIDDEPEFLVVVSQWLTAHGHRPVSVIDSREVMGMIEDERFDLVCMDLLMPYIDGLQLIPMIRNRQAHCPILILSGVNDTRIVVEAMKEGADDYLLKPIDFEKFDAILKRISAVSRS